MFLFWLGIFVVCCIAENLKDSYDAYKYKQSGELDKAFKAFRHEFKPSKELQDMLDKCHEMNKKQ